MLIAGFLLPIFPGIFLVVASPIIIMVGGHKKIYEQGYRDGYGDGKGWTKKEDRKPKE